MSPRSLRVLIMAGGTGGHVFPALAVARVLQSRGAKVEWLGSRHGIEQRLVPAAGFSLNCLDVSGLRGGGLRRWLGAPLQLARALWQAMRCIQRVAPDCVLGMGGFAAGPGGLAAWLLRRPLLIHEQNAVAGVTNRLLRPLARRTFEGFPDTFGGVGVEHVGNPVRAEICALEPPQQRFERRRSEGEPLHLLILGGSLGAAALNELLPAALARLPAELRPRVWHQAGAGKDEACRAGYRQAGVEARVEPFIDAMATAYAWADLVLCRAGALTLAELCCAGVGGLLVPYPFAVDDHQSVNGRVVEQVGGAELLPQATLDAATLAARIEPFAREPARALAMGVRIQSLARPQAAERMADCCEEVAHGQAA